MRRAFTLIELLIYMGISAIFLVVISNVLYVLLSAHVESQNSNSLELDSRFIAIRSEYDAANLVASPSNYSLIGSDLYFSGTKLNSFDTQVTQFTAQKVSVKTVKINFTLVSGEDSRSYETVVGTR